MIFCAHATRGLRKASLDGRSGTNIGALPRGEKQASLEGVGEGRLDGLLCSCNARAGEPSGWNIVTLRPSWV